MSRITYEKSGVDETKASKWIEFIKPIIHNLNKKKGVISEIGGFGGLFDLSVIKTKYRTPVLVASSDGVGTKVKLTAKFGEHKGAGIDLVAMNVNDIIATGAKPLFFLDYIATDKLRDKVMKKIMHGIIEACSEAGCALLGGETAQMPDIYNRGEYDLAGFCVGIVDKKALINISRVKIADSIIGIASSGVHSNGFSLIRKIFNSQELKKLKNQLLTPTRIYVKVIEKLSKRVNLHAIAHITGGGFYSNIKRVLPEGKGAVISDNSWQIPAIFKRIQNKAKINDKEMFSTFNMGIGMVLILSKEDAKKAISIIKNFGFECYSIGKIVKSGRGVVIK